MHLFRDIIAFSSVAVLASTAALLPHAHQQRRAADLALRAPTNLDAQPDVAGFIQALKSHDLSRLADTLQAHQDVVRTILQSPGTKTFLAPNDQAIAGLPQWVTSNDGLLQSTLLMHALNGSYDLSLIPAKPLHLIGHSLLTDQQHANLPGGNGQAVALAFDRENAVVQEASNTNSFVTTNDFEFGSVAVRPLARAMTVPGNATATLSYLASHAHFVKVLQGQIGQQLDDLRGATIFVPSEEALQRYMQSKGNLGTNELEVLVKQHVLAYRTAYGVLLGQQGSMINAAGQNVLFDSKANSVSVGRSTAKVLQYDIMFRGGVMHLLDNVLGEEEYDAGRAQQAAQSALQSANSGVAGPVSYQNAASSQGNSVPGPNANNPNDGFRNSTIQTHDASNGGGAQGANGAGAGGAGINNGSFGGGANGTSRGGRPASDSPNGAAAAKALGNAFITLTTISAVTIVSLLTLFP